MVHRRQQQESTMERAKSTELTTDEMDQVTGGLESSLRTTILNALEVIPILGLVVHVERAVYNGVNGTDK
jgi:bacteriocin-like protein